MRGLARRAMTPSQPDLAAPPDAHQLPTMRRPRRFEQLLLDFEAPSPPPRALSPDDFVQALRRRRVRYIERIRFKNNRTRIIALSRDGVTLHVHACFREAPDEVLDAVASFLKVGRRSEAYRIAIQQLREYWSSSGMTGGWATEESDAAVMEGVRTLRCVGTEEQVRFLHHLYHRFNLLHFHTRLPEGVRIRISDRMASRFGHMRYHTCSSGERVVLEIAINVALFLPGHETSLLDTMLHEMTHVEAWLFHGDRGHGRVWRAIARRVGCEARACSARAIRRRRRGSPPITRVPSLAILPPLPHAQRGGVAASR